MLREVRAKFADRGFEILGIAFVEGDEKGKQWLRDYAAKRGLTWPQAPSGSLWYGPPFEEYSVRYLPFYLILDRKGKVVDADVRDRDKLEALIESLL